MQWLTEELALVQEHGGAQEGGVSKKEKKNVWIKYLMSVPNGEEIQSSIKVLREKWLIGTQKIKPTV